MAGDSINSKIDGIPLRENSFKHSNDLDLSEYLVKVKWHRKVERDEAKWVPKNGLFSTQLVTASLANQPKTIEYIEEEFGIEIDSLAA